MLHGVVFWPVCPAGVCRMEADKIIREKSAIDTNMIRDFLMTYCACFAAVAVFFA
jgi:hypothetical protein